jgi:adenine-specific DNA-methyltransferase
MSVISDLIDKVNDPDLRARLNEEVTRIQKQKKFGLVFEEHLPEATPLYDAAISVGSLVSLKDKEFKEFFRVKHINGDTLICEREDDNRERVELNKSDVVVVAMFGQPIYPCLKPLDAVKNAPDSDLWHTLIEADNYHALQLLVYLYGGMVDCIYIDPPYNTGDKSWKYNNNYVDSSDSFRHSKWLSMMKKRLVLSKKLLNPKDSVLIVTIDEKEYLRLGCLLEELFPEARIQMVSSVISPQGATREKQFSRTDEYIYIIEFGDAAPSPLVLGAEWSAGQSISAGSTKLIWDSLKRRGSNSLRRDRPNLFYPLYVSNDGLKLEKIGESLPLDQDRDTIPEIEGCRLIWPIRSNGDEGNWQVSQAQLKEKYDKGFVRLGKFDDRGSMSISYLKRNEQRKVESGVFHIVGKRDDNSIITDEASQTQKRVCGTQWRITSHNAGTYGTALLLKVLGEKRFEFPKSIYAVHDALRFFVANKPNALIVDFFAGSGTTLHAVNLLNAEDGGKRRCIMVTNNEVSEAETKSLRKQGYQPGDEEWEKWGIARYVNWPRTVCSIEGHDINGNLLKGNYLGSDIPMSDGFAANAQFFKLSFLDKNAVAMDMQFKELLTTLWMKAGAVGECPVIEGNEIDDFYIFPENKMAILKEEDAYMQFKEAMKGHNEIQTLFIITDSDSDFREMSAEFEGKRCYQLYRDYLDNFSINYERN